MQALRKIIALSMMLICMPVLADTYDDPNNPDMPLQGYKYCWMIGFDLTSQIMHPKNDFTYLTYNTRGGADLFAAWRSKGPFGLELGYHWTTAKPKNIMVVPGMQMFGATSAVTATYQSKMRIDDTYIDAYWHYIIKRRAEIKLGVGVGFVREDIETYNLVGDPVSAAITNLYTRTTTTARFNVGLQTMLTKRIGARALFGYQTTSSVKAGGVAQGVDPHMFANSYMFSIGLYYTITGYYDDNPGPNGEFLN